MVLNKNLRIKPLVIDIRNTEITKRKRNQLNNYDDHYKLHSKIKHNNAKCMNYIYRSLGRFVWGQRYDFNCFFFLTFIFFCLKQTLDQCISDIYIASSKIHSQTIAM